MKASDLLQTNTGLLNAKAYMKPKGWEERFDKWYAESYGKVTNDGERIEYENIRNVLETELQKQKEGFVEMIRGMKRPIEPIKFERDEWTVIPNKFSQYNQALDNILKKLGEVK